MITLHRSDNIHDIKQQIEKRVKDGCPEYKLKLFKEIPFNIKTFVTFEGVEEQIEYLSKISKQHIE